MTFWTDPLETNVAMNLPPRKEKEIPPGCRECPMCAGVKGYYRRYSNTWMPCHFCDGKGWVKL